MRRINATISGAVGERPLRLDFEAQKRANPRLCQAITVSGLTIASASDHVDQVRESKIQNARSIGSSRGRGFVPSEHGELLAQRQILRDEARTRPKGSGECGDDCPEKLDHRREACRTQRRSSAAIVPGKGLDGARSRRTEQVRTRRAVSVRAIVGHGMQLVGLVLLGFAAALVASITGGTSLITVPVMIIAGMAPGSAVATNMLVVASLSAGAAARFHRAGAIPLHPTLGLIVASVPGSMLGAFIAVHISENFLRITITVAVVAMATLILFQPEFGARASFPSRRRRLLGYATLGLWSVYGGMFSGGYATVLTMGCVGLFGVSLLESVALTRVVNLLGSLAAMLVFAAQGKINWTVGTAMSLAAVVGGWVGANFALRWGPQTVRRLLFATTMIVAAKVVYDARRSWRSPTHDATRGTQ